MRIKKSELSKLIESYLAEGSIGPSWTPMQSQEQGNLFRKWVNDNKTEEEVASALKGYTDPTLSRTGSHNNDHVKGVWKKFGREFTAAMNAEELGDEKDRLRLRDLIPRRDRDEEDETRPRDQEDSAEVSVIKTPCIIFTGEFSPASDPLLDGMIEKIERSDRPKEKKESLKSVVFSIGRKIPEGHGGTIIIKPPLDGGTRGTAYACEFGRYKGKAPPELENEMNDAFWKELNQQDSMDTTKSWRKKAGLAVPGKVKITRLGSCKLTKKQNGNYTITPESAEPLVEKALRKGGYPGTTRNPIIVDGCVYERAIEYAGPSGDWRPYLLIPGLLPKLITNLIGLDAYKYENCGTYALKVALAGVYGNWSKILSNVMLILAAPETMIRVARVLFPQTWSRKKAVNKRDVLNYRSDRDSEIKRGRKR